MIIRMALRPSVSPYNQFLGHTLWVTIYWGLDDPHRAKTVISATINGNSLFTHEDITKEHGVVVTLSRPKVTSL